MSAGEGADKTEKPTAKRLLDARRKGQVAKSRELTSTAGLALWLVLGSFMTGYAAVRLGTLFESLFVVIGAGWTAGGFAVALRTVGWQAFELTLMLAAMVLVPASIVGLAADFLQTGPVLSFEQLKPDFGNINPAAGVKRMFSLDNLVEVIKALAKTVVLFLLGWLVVKAALPQIVMLARTPDLAPQTLAAVLWSLTLKLVGWTLALFALVSLLDVSYQRWSFARKMRMSLRDIRQESKESEGDPMIKGQRRQAHQEWSQQGAAQAARQANVLVVNPTHIAIAIDYDPETAPVPTIAAKGEGDVARAMREAAEEAGTPIVRNIPLARDMFARGEVGEIVPADLFDILAEVILWAREVREQVDTARASEQNPMAARTLPERRIDAPGEDLTRYRDGA